MDEKLLEKMIYLAILGVYHGHTNAKSKTKAILEFVAERDKTRDEEVIAEYMNLNKDHF